MKSSTPKSKTAPEISCLLLERRLKSSAIRKQFHTAVLKHKLQRGSDIGACFSFDPFVTRYSIFANIIKKALFLGAEAH